MTVIKFISHQLSSFSSQIDCFICRFVLKSKGIKKIIADIAINKLATMQVCITKTGRRSFTFNCVHMHIIRVMTGGENDALRRL